MNRSFALSVALCAVIGLAAHSAAAWPRSADSNLVICNRFGEQALPKIGATSTGGCYVCWQDAGSGNYDTYLQLLDSAGHAMWIHNGLAISEHPQDTWITDYDMAVDQSDRAIIVINDIRNGTDRDIYAYRINANGVFEWGLNGITISDNDGFEPDPRVAATSGGNAVVAWQEEQGTVNVVHLRKLTPEGADVWEPATITLTSVPYGLSIPRVVAADNDAVILQYLVHRGSGMYAARHIFMQKFDSLGVPMWGDTGLCVSSAGGIAAWMKPNLIPDGAGGAYAYWYDTRDGTHHHVFVQHVSAQGVPLWTTNGVQTSLAAGELQMDPTLTRVPGTDQVMAFYMSADNGQTVWGLQGQLLNGAGARQWTANGTVFLALSAEQRSNIIAVPQDSGAAVVYLTGSVVNSQVRGFRVNTAGDLLWPGQHVTLCSVPSGKGRMAADVNGFGQTLAVWPDSRINTGDIYLQNVNPDGSLGDLTPQPSPSIRIISPPDGAEVDSLPLTVEMEVENFDVAAEGGDGVVQFRLNGNIMGYLLTDDPFAIDSLRSGNNTIALELVSYDHLPLDPPAADSVQVTYTPSAVQSREAPLPTEPYLAPAYPNPFNSALTIRYALPRTAPIRLEVFDTNGRLTATLKNGLSEAGSHSVTWQCPDCGSGVYWVRLTTAGRSLAAKVLLIK
jgi:hypothetical protein